MTRFATIVVLVASASASAADPADHREANALYKEGVRLFTAGEYTGALELFESAYKKYDDPRIAYAIATALRQVGRMVDAANVYERFARDARAEPKLAADAETALEVLRGRLGTLDLGAPDAASQIQIDDGPWQPARARIYVDPGPFVVRARRTGSHAEARGSVAASARETVVLRWLADPAPNGLSRVEPDADPREVGDPAAPRLSRRRIYALTIGGAGLASGGTAIALEWLARDRIRAAERACPSLSCNEPAYTGARSLLAGANVERIAAVGLAVAAAGGIATGVALWLTDHPAPSIRVTPAVDDRAAMLFVGGPF